MITYNGSTDRVIFNRTYKSYVTERKKHPKALRNSGGIIMFISNSICKGVTKVAARANRGGDAIWVKLDKSFLKC